MSSTPQTASPDGAEAQTPSFAVLLCNLGTPLAPTAAALRPWLAEFLGDPRVVEIPRAVWLPILYGFILPFRPAKSAAKYASIWTPEGSPLQVWTERQATALQLTLQQRGHRCVVLPGMRYGQPAIGQQLQALDGQGIRRVLVLPAYPQYSGTTTASLFDAVHQWCALARWVPELRTIGQYPDDAGYIAALAARVREHWAANGQTEVLLMSFHGIPERNVTLGDPYADHCRRTAAALAQALELPDNRWAMSFQSRFGKAKWLEPYTEPTLQELARAGRRRVDVICPGFVADCLETLEEIAMEGREAFLHAGGSEFHYIDCLNARPDWIDAMATMVERNAAGWTDATSPA